MPGISYKLAALNDSCGWKDMGVPSFFFAFLPRRDRPTGIWATSVWATRR